MTRENEYLRHLKNAAYLRAAEMAGAMIGKQAAAAIAEDAVSDAFLRATLDACIKNSFRAAGVPVSERFANNAKFVR